MGIALIGHALVLVMLILMALEGGVSLAVHVASATPTPRPTALPTPPGPTPPAPTRVLLGDTTVVTEAVIATPEPTARPTATGVPSPTPPAMSAVDAGGRGARLREGPGLRAAILGVLPEQMLVSMLGPEADEDGRAWRRIRSPDGREGWVDAGLLAPVGAPAPAAAAAGRPIAAGFAEAE